MKKKVNENIVQNKIYKTTILKIYSESPNIKYSIQEIKTVKITSHDIMNSIDNLEYLENNHLDLCSPEDKLLFKYGRDIVIKDYEKFIKRSDYKKVTKYLKDNNINETLIYKHISIIYDYLNSNDKIDLETLKKAILSLENSKYSYIEHNTLIERPRKSDETISINETREINYNYLRCVIKMTEYIPISGGSISEMNKIPDLFLNKRSLLVLRNNDNKCFLYCFIREFLNPITKNRFRITKRDKELADKIIIETNLTFENVSINEMNKIEKKKLEVNINVFSCNKFYKNKNPVRKSKENYDKTLDLLLIDDINHYIIIKNLHCFLTDRCSEKDNFTCRICLNIFYSDTKYSEDMTYCKTRKPQRLMPSNEKHIKFNKLQNCMLNNFVIYSDFECVIDKNNEHAFISGVFD